MDGVCLVQAFKTHRTVDAATKARAFCSTHNQHKQMYCHTCNATMCPECLPSTECKHHSFEHISKANEQISDDMKAAKEQLQHTADQLTQQVKHIEHLMQSKHAVCVMFGAWMMLRMMDETERHKVGEVGSEVDSGVVLSCRDGSTRSE